MNKYLILITFVATGVAFFANAQLFEAITSVTLEVYPESPDPGAEVRAKLTTFSFDLDKSNIRWFLGMRLLSEGEGKKEIVFNAGPVGSVDKLSASITTPEGGKIEKNIEVRSSQIDLLVESKSFIPPWYRGSALISPQSDVKVTAIPNFISGGILLNPSSLNFSWSLEGEKVPETSGIGKQSFSFKAARGAGAIQTVSVKAESRDGLIVKTAETSFETHNPEILFYERKPLEGTIFVETISAKIIPSGSNLEIEAVPLFMNISTFRDLNFQWNFNNKIVEADADQPSVFTIKSNSGEKGEAIIKLMISNLRNVLEEVRASFIVYAE
ncbi:hypothetical protein HYW53_01220 [Candidatus Giovannonibacteria bacterium]|nr:hypothetical protein [Candidatus Giovannonibacteria bacterium]